MSAPNNKGNQARNDNERGAVEALVSFATGSNTNAISTVVASQTSGAAAAVLSGQTTAQTSAVAPPAFAPQQPSAQNSSMPPLPGTYVDATTAMQPAGAVPFPGTADSSHNNVLRSSNAPVYNHPHPFVQSLYNLIKADEGGTIVSFHIGGGFEVYDWRRFEELLVRHQILKKDSNSPASFFHMELGQFGFVQEVRKNSWLNSHFTKDGKALSAILQQQSPNISYGNDINTSTNAAVSNSNGGGNANSSILINTFSSSSDKYSTSLQNEMQNLPKPASNISGYQPEVDSFVQKLYNLIRGDQDGTIVSFKHTGGFEIHNLEAFKNLLVVHELSKKDTRNPIDSLQRRLSLYDFKKVIGKNVYKWNQDRFTADGKFLHEIWSTTSSKRSLKQLQKGGRGSSDDDAGVQLGKGRTEESTFEKLELRVSKIEALLDMATTGIVTNGATAGDVILPRPQKKQKLSILVENTDERMKRLESSLKERDVIIQSLQLGIKQLNDFVVSNKVRKEVLLSNENGPRLLSEEDGGKDFAGQEDKVANSLGQKVTASSGNENGPRVISVEKDGEDPVGEENKRSGSAQEIPRPPEFSPVGGLARCVSSSFKSIRWLQQNKNQQDLIKTVKRDGLALRYASVALKNDRAVVIEAVKQNGRALRYASEDLKNDATVVLEAVKQVGSALEYAKGNLKNDKNVAVMAVKQEGGALKYASEQMKNDKEVVLEAVRRDGFALEYASEVMKNDRQVVIQAVEQDGFALEYASVAMKDDNEVVMAATAQNEFAFDFASERLKNQKDLRTRSVDTAKKDVNDCNMII